MEKQRSFSIKPTRFLVFSFTISSSVIFLTFFSIWVMKAPLSFHQETNFRLNKPSFILALKPATVQVTGFSRNNSASTVRNSISIGAHLTGADNTSDIADVSGVGEIQSKESEPRMPDAEAHKADAPGVYLAEIGAKPLASAGNNSFLITTHLSGSEKISGIHEDPVFKKLQRKENASLVPGDAIHADNAVNTNSTSRQQNLSLTSSEIREVSPSDWMEEKIERVCDVTKGRWVFDESLPLYTNVSCPFIDEGFNCETNGRFDKDYMKWRWQPRNCNLPRFNATKMLELIRGKRLVFVGDSINRNQWESMLCLMMGAVKDPKKVYETHRRKITKEKGNYSFKFVDYKCTVEYYVTHFLVHESKARVGKRRVQTLRIDTIDRGSSRWKGADILVFNTAHWWAHYKTRAGINYYQEGDLVHPHLPVSTAFRRAMLTWASWVDAHITRGKTQVFFRSSAPSHFRGGTWNAGGHCKEASWPVNETSSANHPGKDLIAEEVVRQMKTPVTFLNVTGLSGYRIDGHPSVYGRRSGSSYSSRIQDCSHWCLPGVPDTWNELLYFHLQLKRWGHFAV